MEAGPPKPDARTISAFATVVVLLGVNFVAVRFSNAEMAPFWGSAFRFFIAAGIFFGLSFVRRVPFPEGAALRSALLYGALAFGGVYALLYWALLFVPSGATAVIFATVPLSTFVIAVGLRMEKMRWTALGGALLAFAGIAVITGGQLLAATAPAPLIAIAVGSVCASAAGIVVKRAPKAHPFSTNAVAMAVGAAILLAGSLVAAEPRALPTLAVTWAAFAWLVTSSVVAFSLLVWILKRWTASAASYQAVLSPLVTIAVALALVGEPVTLLLSVGTSLVLLGVYLGAVYRPRTADSP